MRKRRVRWAWLCALAAPVIAGAQLLRCATPATITVEVYSDVDCNDTAGDGAQVVFFSSEGVPATLLQGLQSAGVSASANQCQAVGNGEFYRGNIVLIPHTAGESIAFAVATRLGDGDPKNCIANEADAMALAAMDECIVVERGPFAFIDHEGLTMRVDLNLACAGVSCPLGLTCDNGDCVPAGVICSDAGSCSTTDAAPPPIDGSLSCSNYCNNITALCNGPNNQYLDPRTCEAMCQFFPNSGPPPANDAGAGTNSLACRMIQLNLATTMPSQYCPLAGPYGFDACGALDLDFCNLDFVAGRPCSDANANYTLIDQCEQYFTANGDSSAPDPGNVLTAPALACREYQLESAYQAVALATSVSVACAAAGFDGGGVCP